jgi:hypothetical protein
VSKKWASIGIEEDEVYACIHKTFEKDTLGFYYLSNGPRRQPRQNSLEAASPPTAMRVICVIGHRAGPQLDRCILYDVLLIEDADIIRDSDGSYGEMQMASCDDEYFGTLV